MSDPSTVFVDGRVVGAQEGSPLSMLLGRHDWGSANSDKKIKTRLKVKGTFHE